MSVCKAKYDGQSDFYVVDTQIMPFSFVGKLQLTVLWKVELDQKYIKPYTLSRDSMLSMIWRVTYYNNNMIFVGIIPD